MGSARRIGVIINAGDGYKSDDPEARAAWLNREFDSLRQLGLSPVELDLRPYFHQPQAKLATVLAGLDGLWVLGGNSFVLRRAFRYSSLDELLPELLHQDKLVYAGYSAGIDQLVPHLHGVELVDDPHFVPKGYRADIIWDALGILPYALAPHYLSDHPEAADISKSVTYMIDHHIPFIALRDGQVLVRRGSDDTILI
jgi:dipeptidase E